MPEEEWPFDGCTMNPWCCRFNAIPFKKCNHIIGRYLEKIMSKPWFSESCDHTHFKKVSPKQDCSIHVFCSHCQMIDACIIHCAHLVMSKLSVYSTSYNFIR